MIAYEDIAAALSQWRLSQGLPVTVLQFDRAEATLNLELPVSRDVDREHLPFEDEGGDGDAVPLVSSPYDDDEAADFIDQISYDEGVTGDDSDGGEAVDFIDQISHNEGERGDDSDGIEDGSMVGAEPVVAETEEFAGEVDADRYDVDVVEVSNEMDWSAVAKEQESRPVSMENPWHEGVVSSGTDEQIAEEFALDLDDEDGEIVISDSGVESEQSWEEAPFHEAPTVITAMSAELAFMTMGGDVAPSVEENPSAPTGNGEDADPEEP